MDPWLLALVAVNALAFLLFGWDKWKARRGSGRIPEGRLLLCAAVGGAAGGWLAMGLFRHKTQKLGFRVKMVLATAVNGALLWLWWRWWGP